MTEFGSVGSTGGEVYGGDEKTTFDVGSNGWVGSNLLWVRVLSDGRKGDV